MRINLHIFVAAFSGGGGRFYVGGFKGAGWGVRATPGGRRGGARHSRQP